MIQMILLLVTTSVVIITLMYLLNGKQLRIALNRLQILHQESLEKEEVLNKELERAKIQTQSEIERSKEEAKAIIEVAKQNAEKITSESVERSKAEVRKITADAVERAKRVQNEFLEGAREKAIELAQDLIRRTFTAKGQEVLHAQLMDELIEELKKVDKDRIAVKIDNAQIYTPLSLNPEEKKKLKEILVSKLGYEFSLEEKIDDSLIVGMIIKLGGLSIDGSLKNKLNKAIVTLRVNGAEE